jgi:hypothetical protein
MVPYGKWLAGKVSVSTLRIRRDFTQLLTFIMASAIEYKYQRQREPDGRIVANLADYAHVYTLISDAFQAAQAEGVVKADRETVAAVTELSTPANGQPGERPVTQAEVRSELGLSKGGCSYRVRRLIGLGYLANLADKGKPMKLVPGAPLPDEAAALPAPCELARHLAQNRPGLIVPWVDPVTGELHDCRKSCLCSVPGNHIEPSEEEVSEGPCEDIGSICFEPFEPSDKEEFDGSMSADPPDSKHGDEAETTAGFEGTSESTAHTHTHLLSRLRDPDDALRAGRSGDKSGNDSAHAIAEELRAAGAEIIQPLGELFDPHRPWTAVNAPEDDICTTDINLVIAVGADHQPQDGEIVAIAQSGMAVEGRILKEAQVIIYYPSQADPTGQSEDSTEPRPITLACICDPPIGGTGHQRCESCGFPLLCSTCGAAGAVVPG